MLQACAQNISGRTGLGVEGELTDRCALAAIFCFKNGEKKKKDRNWSEGRTFLFNSKHFISGYMASNIW